MCTLADLFKVQMIIVINTTVNKFVNHNEYHMLIYCYLKYFKEFRIFYIELQPVRSINVIHKFLRIFS